jgi:hypothetical protein
MSVYPKNRYVPGTYKRPCDRCAFDFLRSQLVKERRTGLIVCQECHDPYVERDMARRRSLTEDIPEIE